MIERPRRMNRTGGMGVFSNGGMEDEDYIPALEEYVDHLEAERDRLRRALTLANLERTAGTSAIYDDPVRVEARKALQEDRNEV